MGLASNRSRLSAALVAAAIGLLAPAAARGAPDAEQHPSDPARPPASPPHLSPRSDLTPKEKRKKQDYNGRGDEPTGAKGLLWVPRVVFFPVYLVTEYVVRKPLGALLTAVEQNPALSDFLLSPSKVGFIPTAFLDFGFRPSVGIYYFHDDFLAPQNDVRATIATGGKRYLKASVLDRMPLRVDADGKVRTYLQLEVDAAARPDLKFFGIGPSSLSSDEGQYELRTVGGGGRFHVEFWKGAFFEGWANARQMSFGDGVCDGVASVDVKPQTFSCASTTLLEQVRHGRYPVPAGFEKGYAAIKVGSRLVLDSRKPRPADGSGMVAELRGEQGTVLSGARHGSWIAYGASVGGFADLTGKRRVLGLVLDARFQDVVQDRFVIPFTELIGNKRVDYVPEDDLIRGFLPGRLLGTSSLTASLDYEWPIWAFLDGTMQAAVGNVFGDRLRDFDIRRTRFSFVGGLTSPNHRDHQFNLQLGFGTKTFEQGGQPDSLRFLVGGTTGF